ncbi:MAG: hypothetical protein MUF49_29895 [Oculatellaceae cyanobacterium Prado106]|nr:hypothetical protein [Oculatellaceae cyanobacterium Prado106]
MRRNGTHKGSNDLRFGGLVQRDGDRPYNPMQPRSPLTQRRSHSVDPE